MLFMEEIYGDEDQSGDRAARRFWREESFDHLVRTAEHFQAFRRYIADNPRGPACVNTSTCTGADSNRLIL